MAYTMTQNYYKALTYAIKAHDGQYDKSGEPYILHPLAVSFALHEEDEQIAALLHDVVEDTDYTLEDIKAWGFGHLVNTIDCLSRRKEETYREFIYRICTDRLATTVKIADIKHNLSRIDSLPERERGLADRYNKWLPVLEKRQNEFMNEVSGIESDSSASENTYKFGGREHPFSNYYPAPCVYDGITYSTGEGAFQSAKTLDMNVRRKFLSIGPGEAKRLGRRLQLRPDWEEIKYDVMLDVLRSKFNNYALRKQLLDTGERTIVEDTTGWHDNEWGDCNCPKCKHSQGKNLLGKALMELREELRICNTK